MRERGDEDGRGIIAVAERSGIEPWRDQFYNEHSDTLASARVCWRIQLVSRQVESINPIIKEMMNKSEIP
jgi:hypothetical protein